MNMKLNGQLKDEDVLVQDRHTENIQEIITKAPSWILRWGITIFFAILLIAVGVSIMIKYPDIVKGNLKIESSSILKPGIANVNGTVSKVLAEQGAVVKAGQPLIYIVTQYNTKQIAINATQGGKVAYMAIVQAGSILHAGQEVFSIHPEHEVFFGTMEVPTNVISKLRVGQTVLVYVNGYSISSNDKFIGKISYIADEPFKQGFFRLKVIFTNLNKNIMLKSWMSADAEIITQDLTVFSRISKNIFKSMQ